MMEGKTLQKHHIHKMTIFTRIFDIQIQNGAVLLNWKLNLTLEC